MARKTISQRIALTGSEDIREQLKRMGDEGEKAFHDIQSAAEKLKGPGAIGTVISGGWVGDGTLSIRAGAGVSLNGVVGGRATLTNCRSEYSTRKRGANAWHLTGDHGEVS